MIRKTTHAIALLAIGVFLAVPHLFADDNPCRCLKGDCKNGHGSFVSCYGKIYTGEIKNGVPNGKGLYVYPDGKVYYGYWKMNKLEGFGVYMSPDGHKYAGEWKNGRFNGEGTLKFPNGTKLIGTFENDKFVGVSPSKPKKSSTAELDKLLEESDLLTQDIKP